MNKFPFQSMQPQQQFQTTNHGYVLLKNVMKYIPPIFSPDMPLDELEGYIPATVYKDGWHQTAIFRGGCSHFLTTAPNERQFKRLSGTSWTGQLICAKHTRTCKSCGLTLCIAGNPDGFLFDDGNSKYFLCAPHFEEESKELKKAQFREGFASVWSGFGEGFIRGFFGGKK